MKRIFLVGLMVLGLPCFAAGADITINFQQPEQAKAITYAAFSQIYEYDRQLLKVRKYAIKAFDYSLTDDARLKLDTFFQAQLLKLDDKAHEAKLNFPLVAENPFSIDISDSGNMYHFFIDLSGMKNLPMEVDKETAPDVLMAVNEILITIQQGLPTSTSISEWQEFSVDYHPDEFKNHLFIRNQDIRQFAKNLVAIRSDLLKKFTLLANLLENYISSNGSDSAGLVLSEVLVMLPSECKSINLLDKVVLFSDTRLDFVTKHKEKHYSFPFLDLRNYQFVGINIKTARNARLVLSMIEKMQIFIREWTIAN